MMNINSIDGTNMNMQMGQKNFLGKEMDSVSKSIQNQIGNAQKQLQELSSNKEMSMEEKMKKRQEIQEQIQDLNKQLRQHQIDQRKEMQKTKEPSTDNTLGSSKKAGSSKTAGKGAGLSQASMTAMISADSAMNEAKHLGGVVTQMKGQKNTLAMEIKLDAQRGKDVEAKQADLADLEERIMKTEASQVAALNTAGKEMEEASKTDQPAEKTGNHKDKRTENNKDKKAEKTEKTGENQSEENGKNSMNIEKSSVDTEKETGNIEIQAGIYYTKIDVLL